MDSLTEYTEAIIKVNSFLDRFPTLAAKRKALANPTKPNPVTRVAERLAEPEFVTAAVGSNIQYAGIQFLKSIHTEIDAQRPQWEIEREEEEARMADKEALMGEITS